MKISIPPLHVNEDEGFSAEKDLFKRKPFGDALLKLITSIEDEMVIALDAPWGEGKTTFIQMWRGTLAANNIPNIYFDAFANDYIDDPFVALSGEIYQLAKKINAPDEKINAYKERAIKAGKILLKSGAKIAIKSLTLGALDGTELEAIGADKDLATELSKISENYISAVLESYEEDKQSFNSFRKAISELAEHATENNKPLVFIIDELDRCRPIFAIELLEKIKHVFSIPKIVFLLVINREQLEESVKSQYGSGINSTQYLQKFINVWSHLPKNSDRYSDDSKIYLKYLIEQHNFPISNHVDHAVIENMEDYLDFFKLTLREIEQAVVNMVLVRVSYSFESEHNVLVPFLSILKVKYPALYRKIQNSETDFEEVNKTLKLDNLVATWFEGKDEKHPVTWLFKFCLISEEELQQKPQNYFDRIGFRFNSRKKIIPLICNAMSAFHVSG